MTLDDSEFIVPGSRVPGDFRRTSSGKPYVAAPGGKKYQGNKAELVAIAQERGLQLPDKFTVADLHDILGPDVRHVVYDRYSHWPLHDWTNDDLTPANRGTHCHSITDMAELGIPLSDEFIAAGVALDIPADVQQEIYDGWLAYREEIGLRSVLMEFRSVNDTWRKAGTPDRLDEATKEIRTPFGLIQPGDRLITDTKTGADYTPYVMQLTAAADGVPYDPDADERLPWPDDIAPHQRIGIVHQYAIRDRIEGNTDVRWVAKAVDLDVGRWLGNRLRALIDDSDGVVDYAIRPIARPAVAFPGRADVVDEIAAPGVAVSGDTVAAPDERTANVSTVEQPAGETTSPASPAKPDDEARCGECGGHLSARSFPDAPNLTAACDDCGTRHGGRSYDVDRFGRPILPPAEEGDDADPAAVAVLKARYAALDLLHGKAWVNAVAKDAQAAGGALSLADSQPQSIRRFEAMRGLVLLAEGGFADDAGVRGILRPILGDVADMAAFSVGKLVAALTPAEAATFASLVEQVVDGAVSLAVKLDGRYEWEFAA